MTAHADHIARHALDFTQGKYGQGHEWVCRCGDGGKVEGDRKDAIAAHAAHVVAAWTEHRTITTVEELDALPKFTVVRGNNETWEYAEWGWWTIGQELPDGPHAVPLPAIVIFNPEEDQ